MIRAYSKCASLKWKEIIFMIFFHSQDCSFVYITGISCNELYAIKKLLFVDHWKTTGEVA